MKVLLLWILTIIPFGIVVLYLRLNFWQSILLGVVHGVFFRLLYDVFMVDTPDVS